MKPLPVPPEPSLRRPLPVHLPLCLFTTLPRPLPPAPKGKSTTSRISSPARASRSSDRTIPTATSGTKGGPPFVARASTRPLGTVRNPFFCLTGQIFSSDSRRFPAGVLFVPVFRSGTAALAHPLLAASSQRSRSPRSHSHARQHPVHAVAWSFEPSGLRVRAAVPSISRATRA